MKRLILTSLCVLALFVLPALAEPVNVYSVNGPQDRLSVRGWGDEVGGNGFPADEKILVDNYWQVTDPVCTGPPYDNPNIYNLEVIIQNKTTRTFSSLWYVGDTHFDEKLGLVYDTTCSNYDGFIGNAGLGDAGYAFKIDNVGVNKPLVWETMGKNGLFEPNEYWYFIIQDFANTSGNSILRPLFNNIGIASLSGGAQSSTGSIVANIPENPEPATIALLGLGALSLIRKKRA
jgi:hypothetical protein